MPTSLLTVTPLTASGISHVFDNIPSSGLILWLDASKIAGITSGTSLSAWTDTSSSANHVSNSLVTQQAKYFTASSPTGLPTVRFTTNAGCFYRCLSVGTVAQPYTLISAASFNANGANNVIMFDGLTGTGRASLFALSSGSGAFYCGAPELDHTQSIRGWHTVSVLINSVSTFRVSGSAITGSVGNNSIGSGFMLGASEVPDSFFTGDVGEVLLYNRNLTAVEVAQAESYLSAKWGAP